MVRRIATERQLTTPPALQDCSIMKTASVRDLRPRYSTLLGWIEAGEQIVNKQRGKTIARLVPAHDAPSERVDWSQSPPSRETDLRCPRIPWTSRLNSFRRPEGTCNVHTRSQSARFDVFHFAHRLMSYPRSISNRPPFRCHWFPAEPNTFEQPLSRKHPKPFQYVKIFHIPTHPKSLHRR